MRKPISKVSLLVALLGLVALLLAACGGPADRPTGDGNFVNQQPGSQSGGGFTVSPITPGSQPAAPNVQTSSEQIQSINSNGQAVRGIAYSPDGKLVATGSADKTLRLLDAATGQPANVKLPEAAEPVVAVAFHKDGKNLVVAQQKSVTVYDVASGKQTANWTTAYEVRALGVGGDNKTVATAGLSDNVTLWDSTSGKETASLKGLGLYYGVAVSPDGKLVASASRTGSVDVFEVASAKRVKQLYGLGADVRSVGRTAIFCCSIPRSWSSPANSRITRRRL
jgi:WD40 repeat protein